MFHITDVISIVFTGAVIVSLVSIYLAKSCTKYSKSVELNTWYKLRTTALLILGTGFITHTFGDLMFNLYGPGTEDIIESIAHVIIMIALLLLAYVSKITLKLTEKLGLEL
ncbi:hypothetical protein J4219_09330 [Candidatus Woesearchaeota archaeon]|nr:hypothetical protein [Candidatus Woesearchaeota archaeon]